LTLPIPRRSSGTADVRGGRGKRRQDEPNAERHGTATDGLPAGIVGGGKFDADGVSNVADGSVVPGVRRLRDQSGRAEHAQTAAKRRHDGAAAAQDRGDQPEQTTAETDNHGQFRPTETESEEPRVNQFRRPILEDIRLYTVAYFQFLCKEFFKKNKTQKLRPRFK